MLPGASPLPECFYFCSYIFYPADLVSLPLPWKDLPVLSPHKPFVKQNNYTPVLLSSDDSAGRLQYFIHPRVQIGIIKPFHMSAVEILFQYLPVIAHLRESCSNNHCPDQPVLCEVNAL